MTFSAAERGDFDLCISLVLVSYKDCGDLCWVLFNCLVVLTISNHFFRLHYLTVQRTDGRVLLQNLTTGQIYHLFPFFPVLVLTEEKLRSKHNIFSFDRNL